MAHLTSDGRPIAPCGAAHPEQVKANYHPIVCNRVAGHGGAHQVIDPGTFAVEVEWASTSTANVPGSQQEESRNG